MTEASSVIHISNLYCRYGKRKNTVNVLNGISMSITKGTLYSLLGPSGCGKTSLLSCVIGQLNPNVGSVLVMGTKPNSGCNGVPGPNLGYMPQTISLHSYFNALEILKYYSLVFGVKNPQKKIAKLLQKLDFYDGRLEKRQISLLSGGQKRRVSLACALIHDPQLILL